MNLLITGAWNSALQHIKEIESMGHIAFFLQCEKDRLPCKYEEVDGIICNGLFLYHDIKKFSNLKYIQLTSAGYDRVPMDYITKNSIQINAKGVYSIPMAEFALCGVLQLYKQSHLFYKNQLVHKWEKNRDLLELYGKTICIVGCGNIGNECAIRFKSMGCDILGVDIKPYENSIYSEMVSLSNIKKVIIKSDVVILTLPLTNESKYLFNDEMLSLMKLNSIIVNISRGGVINENDLIMHLKDNLLGAVLDVFEEEPLLCKSTLWEMENVIVTPHNSFIGENNQKRLSNIINLNLRSIK